MEQTIRRFHLKAKRGKYPIDVLVTNLGNISLENNNKEPVYLESDDTIHKYSAFISQVGTNAPTSIVLIDSVNEPVWARTSTGTYTLTKVGEFVAGKTIPNKEEHYTDVAGNLFKINRTSTDVITLLTYASSDIETLADGVLTDQLINIEIYQ